MARNDRDGGFHEVAKTIVMLGLLGLLGWNIIVVGPEGYPGSVILGGLLGAYSGIDQLRKRKNDGGSDDSDGKGAPPGGD